MLTTSNADYCLLDHIAFRDWIANRAGFYQIPDRAGVVRVALDRGGPLRITDPVTGAPIALSTLDPILKGRYVSGLDIERTIPAVPLPRLRRRSGAGRLALETELQRKRLLPLWLHWLRGAAEAKNAVHGLDLLVLRYVPKATFSELAFMATLTPSIGPELLSALYRRSPRAAIRLFRHWATIGQHARFRELGEPLTNLVQESVGTPHIKQLVRVVELIVTITTEEACGIRREA